MWTPRPQTRPNDHQRESRRRSTQTPPEAARDHVMSHDNHVIRYKPGESIQSHFHLFSCGNMIKNLEREIFTFILLFYNELPLSYCLTWCTDLLGDYQSLHHTQWLENREKKHEERERQQLTELEILSSLALRGLFPHLYSPRVPRQMLQAGCNTPLKNRLPSRARSLTLSVEGPLIIVPCA